MIVYFDETRLDVDHRDALVLDCLYKSDGEANSADIAELTGLETWEVHEAHKRCNADSDGPELIAWNGRYDEVAKGPGSDPRIYELTGAGRAICNKNIPSKVIRMYKDASTVPAKQLDSLELYIERVEQKVDDLPEESLSELRRITENGEMDDDVRAEIEERIGEVEEYLFEWTETAETYLIAIRHVLERELGVEMGRYLNQVETERL
jgi:hypothetical protein